MYIKFVYVYIKFVYVRIKKQKIIKIYGKKSRKKKCGKKNCGKKKTEKTKKIETDRNCREKKEKPHAAPPSAPPSPRATHVQFARGRGHATVRPLAISPDGVQQPSSLCCDPNRPRPFAALLSQPSNARAYVDLTAG